MRFTKLICSTLFALCISSLPTMADSTNISLSGNVQDFLIVQLERTDNTIVSSDDFQAYSSEPSGPESLNFGNVDALGVNPGVVTAVNSTPPSVQRVVLDANRNIYAVNNPPTMVKGALYYIKQGYQIRTIRSPGPLGEMTTDVDVYNDGELKTFVDLSTENTLSLGSQVSSSSLRNAGSGAASMTRIKSTVANNDPFAIDVGFVIENTTLTGVKSSVITFTGT